MEKRRMPRAHTKIPGFTTEDLLGELEELVSVMAEGIVKRKGVVIKMKYKPVAKKVKPVVMELPGKYRIIWEIKGDLLANMPVLEMIPKNSVSCPIDCLFQVRIVVYDVGTLASEL